MSAEHNDDVSYAARERTALVVHCTLLHPLSQVTMSGQHNDRVDYLVGERIVHCSASLSAYGRLDSTT
jgi:hypothetical protein